MGRQTSVIIKAVEHRLGRRLHNHALLDPATHDALPRLTDHFLSAAIFSAQVLCICSISAWVSGLPLGQVGAPVLSRA